MDDWKMQQHGNLGPEADDSADPDMAMYSPLFISNPKSKPVL